MRKIIHVDMDAFYASVEQRDDPSLKGKPVVVAWSPEPRSVVCAASYEARRFGIHSAMPAARAVRLCRDAVFIRPNFEKYTKVSKQIREIFRRYTPLVEPLSLDEAYLDVTEPLIELPSATEIARSIRADIRSETDLTASAGVAPNKFLAKIASDWRKPDGLFVIKPHQVEAFLEPLPVGKVPGVGKVTESHLQGRGIMTIGDLKEFTVEELTKEFGSFGERLWELARGIDEHPVIASWEPKSFSSENTFRTDITIEEVATFLDEAAAELWETAERKKLIGRTVTVKLRSADFSTATRRLTLPEPPKGVEELRHVARLLLTRFAFPAGSRYRLAGIGLSNFNDGTADDEPVVVQRSLF